MSCLSEDQMLNHTSDSLEHQQIGVSGIPTEKCIWLKMSLLPPNNKSRGQIAKVTAVKSFTAPKKSQVFVTSATILSTLRWWLLGKLNL